MEETATVRHEYVGGMIYAMVGATKRHNQIGLNIASRLLGAARGGPCRVYASDVKLRASDDAIYYPDVMVACEPEDDPLVEHKPCLVVEVASPSTESIDRREKMLAYRKTPTLQAYLIIAQDERRVERHWRDESGEWRQGEAVGEGFVPIPYPESGLPLAEIYEGL
ncbi:MAG: Uma2 family endonuclease [Actinomycetota bacterium]|nr:Uma2 family endonuclease [Actinomycetota bacterium]